MVRINLLIASIPYKYPNVKNIFLFTSDIRVVPGLESIRDGEIRTFLVAPTTCGALLRKNVTHVLPLPEFLVSSDALQEQKPRPLDAISE
jgi:uncharacterized LabA/DUF88 family protein